MRPTTVDLAIVLSIVWMVTVVPAAAQAVATAQDVVLPQPTAPSPTTGTITVPVFAGVQVNEPLSGSQRVRWAIDTSVGPKSLGAGVISAAWGVAWDRPDEYGANWRGFGKRYVVRLSGVGIGAALEAGVGAIWDEDPRYQRAGAGSLWRRIAHAGQWTVLAPDRDGRLRPAYARAIGNVGNNFITNAWRVDSDSSVNDALSRSGVGVASKFVGNLFDEFWPDIQRRVLRRQP